jgi:hypothetical protein
MLVGVLDVRLTPTSTTSAPSQAVQTLPVVVGDRVVERHDPVK